jgi:probable HAF family extracellular repeat protein
MNISFKTINDNRDPTFNQLLGINNEGEIAGYFGNGTTNPNKGYTVNSPYGQGNYTNENFPGSTQTQVTGINNNDGHTAGFWVDGAGNNFGFVDIGGQFIDVVDPHAKGAAAGGATFEQLLGLNDNHTAVGFYNDANGNAHGFTYDIKSGSFDAVNVSGFASVTAAAINNEGHIAGFVSNGGNDEGFLKEGNKVELLKGPAGAVSVMALGVNNEDQVVGSYTDASGATHGFLYDESNKSYTTINDPNTAKSGPTSMTVVNGINDKGQLVGFYLDAAGNNDGMLVQVSGHK